MAAAEYYGSGAGSGAVPPHQPPQQTPQQAPRPNPPPPTTLQTPPYPMFDGPPPPYSPGGAQQRPHSLPPPQQRVRFDTSSSSQQQQQPAYQARPSGGPPQQFDTHQYPPEKVPLQPNQRPSNLQNMYRPSDFSTAYQHPQQPAAAPSGYPPPGMAPAGPGYGPQRPPQRRYSSNTGYPPAERYDSDSRSRSRSRSRHRHRHDHGDRTQRPTTQRKKSSGVNTFLGAGGGAILGDLIFPGLGTIGGAILGGVGGHEYGRQRSEYGTTQRPRNSPRPHARTYSNDRDYHDDEYRRGRK